VRRCNCGLETQAKPVRDVTWSTGGTRVHWVKLEGGYSTVNWGSALLAPKLAAQQASVAGLQALSEDL
jgi:hypothetical protein